MHTKTSSQPAVRTRSWATAVAAVLVALLAGATTAIASAQAATPAGVAWLRAAHLVPGVGAARVDLVPTAGGATQSVVMSPQASYGDVTSYQKIRPGTYTVSVRPVGSSNAPTLSRRFTITTGKAMTLAVIGTQAAPRLAALVDDLTPPAAGDVSVRVLPAASGAETLTVSAVNGPVIADGAVLGQASAYRAVPAGRWTLKVAADGMAAAQSAVTLKAGGVYTVVVLGEESDDITAKVVTDAAGISTALPQGGAQTGGGGTAPSALTAVAPTSDRSSPLLLAALLAVAVGAALTRRLLPVRVRVRR